MTERNCASCACHAWMSMADGKLEEGVITTAQGITHNIVCRRNEPGAQRVRVQAPVTYLSKTTGKMEVAKDPRTGIPRMEDKEIMQIGHRPTAPDAVCFDGWRPLGTAPGEKWEMKALEGELRAALQGFTGGFGGDQKAN